MHSAGGAIIRHVAASRSPAGVPRRRTPAAGRSLGSPAAPGPMSDGRRIVDFPDSAWHGKPRRRRRRSRARGVAPKANPRPEARLRGPGADIKTPLPVIVPLTARHNTQQMTETTFESFFLFFQGVYRLFDTECNRLTLQIALEVCCKQFVGGRL